MKLISLFLKANFILFSFIEKGCCFLRKLSIGLVIGFIVGLLYFFDTFYLLENDIQDRLTIEEQQGDLRIKILGIDDASLNEVGRWPWSREILADVADTLLTSGAKAVWFDLVFSEPSQNSAQDEKLQTLVQSYEHLYLSSYFNFVTEQDVAGALDYISYQEPIFDIPDEQVGHINVFQDQDRVVRKNILGVPMKDGQIVPAISVRLANLLLPEDSEIHFNKETNSWYRGNEAIKTNARNEVIFSYASNPRQSSFDVFSIKDVMNGAIPADYFSDSLVLIGPYTVGLQDQYLTPMSKTIPMNGVEIHANTIQSLTEGHLFDELAPISGLILVIGLSGIGYLVMELIRSKYLILIALGLVVLYIIVFLFVFNQFNIIFPLFYPLLAIIFIYIATIVTHFVEEQLEKRRITTIFGRYVSKNIVDDLINTKEDVTVGGERKDVTLMFVDIRGFTPLSEKMEPEEVVEVLNEYLELCSQAIFKYEGTIDKFMGDGIMVIFGAPVAQEDHALRAVNTALAMQEQGKALTKRLEENYGHAVAFGVGINSGPAIVGNIGSQDRLDYTAIGDTVNLAARLESIAKPNQILLSESTYELVKGEIDCQSLEPVQVKGKSKRLKIYEVTMQ